MPCKRCGTCCTRLRIQVRNEDARLFWNLHGFGNLGEDVVLGIEAPCRWLIDEGDGTTSCSHYGSRPEVCHSFLCDGAR